MIGRQACESQLVKETLPVVYSSFSTYQVFLKFRLIGLPVRIDLKRLGNGVGWLHSKAMDRFAEKNYFDLSGDTIDSKNKTAHPRYDFCSTVRLSEYARWC